MGNHEYQTPGASGYYNYFGAAAGDPNKGYYSYDLGQWHIISLNSMCENVGGCGATSPMVTWLKARPGRQPEGVHRSPTSTTRSSVRDPSTATTPR